MTNWAIVKVPVSGHISQADLEAMLMRIGKRIGLEQSASKFRKAVIAAAKEAAKHD